MGERDKKEIIENAPKTGERFQVINRYRSQGLRLKYGMTVQEYENKRLAQDFKCLICKKDEQEIVSKNYKYLCVDHDHSCCPGIKTRGKCIRGLLCHACNTLIGKAGDNIDLLLSCIEYIQSFRKESNNVSIP